MKQRLIKSVAVLLSLLPAISFAHDFEVNGIYYKITSSTDKTVDVTYMGDQSNSAAYIGTVDIPGSVSYQGSTYTVTGIGEDAFYRCDLLARVDIPTSVTAIKGGSFSYCGSLSKIIIPSSVNTISSYAFQGCHFVAENFINLSSLSSSMNWNATIYNNSTEENGLIIQNGVTLVKARANITTANIPETITSIGASAFKNCKYLNSIDIPNSVTSIGRDAFYGSGINHEIIVNNIYVYAPTNVTAVTIPSGVTHINASAFQGCLSLSSVSIPESVTSIGEDAFSSCGLTSISIPSSVTTIGRYAFMSTHIEKAEFASIESLCKISFGNDRSNPLSYNGHLYINGREVTSVEIPDGVTNLNYTFYGCKYILSVTIPNSVTSIDYAFPGCEKLTSIVIPKGVTSMNDAFPNCTGLRSVTIPNSMIYMNNAFVNCVNLTSVIIPSNVKELDAAFVGCTSLNSVTNLSAIPQSHGYIFPGNIRPVLHVLPESVDAYKANMYWGGLNIVGDAVMNDICIYDGINNEFSNASDKNLETITYTRNFTNTNWNALYVPFSMSYEDWADDFEIARLNDVHQFDDNEDGVVDRTVLESVKLKDGSSTEPNTPYMIKAKEVGEKTITLTDATLYAADENSFDVTSWFTRFNFTGTYHEVTNMATAGHYAMADGGLKQASSDAVTLGAFRWYLDITDRNGNPAPLAAKKILLSFDDGETTEIEVVNAQSQSGADVYTISGVKVSNDKNALPKGIYIMNGKKVIIK